MEKTQIARSAFVYDPESRSMVRKEAAHALALVETPTSAEVGREGFWSRLVSRWRRDHHPEGLRRQRVFTDGQMLNWAEFQRIGRW